MELNGTRLMVHGGTAGSFFFSIKVFAVFRLLLGSFRVWEAFLFFVFFFFFSVFRFLLREPLSGYHQVPS